MHSSRLALLAALGLSVGPLCAPAGAAPFAFSTGTANGLLASASRPAGTFEIESADDFPVTVPVTIMSGGFTGLIPTSTSLSAIERVRVRIYRVFPQDSDVSRTSGPPSFSTPMVPNRVNSPSDIEFAERDSTDAGLSFGASTISGSFAASNSVQPGGIHSTPGQTTGGTGPVSGEEVALSFTFSPGLTLAAGHYYFVPQVTLSSGEFLWLSAPKPIVAPGTPFPVGTTDLQSETRDAGLAPDWLRVGTDIVGGGASFNATFSLAGTTCPAISVAPAALPAATGGPYLQTFSASGGTAPYTYTETGPLPAGVTLSATGSLAGTPTQAGTFAIVVSATDSAGCAATQNETLVVPASAIPTVPGPLTLAPGPSPGPPLGSPQPAPAISAAHLSPTTFRAATHGATLARKRRTPIGATVSYRDSQAATTTFAVLRRTTGHRSATTCRAGTPHKHQKRCTRYVALGSSTHRDSAGAVKVRFSARVRGRRLKAGHYRLTLTPKAGSLTGRSVALAFRIV